MATKQEAYAAVQEQPGLTALVKEMRARGFKVDALVVRGNMGPCVVWDPKGVLDPEDMAMELIINSRDSLHEAFGKLRDSWERHKWLRVQVTEGTHRSLNLNALSHVWYGEIAKVTGETPEEVKSEYKLRLGVPILRQEDPEFRELYDIGIRRHLSYEQKLAAMRYLPVTSLMTQKQMKRYMDDLQKTVAKEHGIQVEYPSD